MENRFEVSTVGMRELHAGRPLWSLVKELVANVWDEDATICKVSVRASNNGNITKPIECIDIVVEDDAAGFKDIDDAFTLMAPTAKRQDAAVRGRFNIGEKEIISIALRAEVKTVGATVSFPESGGREVTKNRRKKGTVVSVRVERPWSEIEDTVGALMGFIPPSHITYTVNDMEPARREFIGESKGFLQTVKSDAIGQPLRLGWANNMVQIYKPLDGETGHIYEMGITIQPIEAPYDVDVQQKVPMPPNRDTVTASYLQRIFSTVLKLVAPDLAQEQASETWVQAAVEDKATPDKTVAMVMVAKLGERAVLWSSDTQANEMAHDAGMDIIHPRTLSKKERERFTGLEPALSPLVSAAVGFGHKTDEGEIEIIDPDYESVTSDMQNVAEYAKWLSKCLLGFECNVRFIKMKAVVDNRIAQYGGGTLDFVPERLGKQWFEMWENETSTRGATVMPKQHHTELILHELAHEGMSKTPHTGEYVHRIAELGAKATHLAMQGGWWSKEVK